MFTILHQKDGADTFYSARAVTYHGPFAALQQSDGYALELMGGTDGNTDGRMLYGGVAYVMNAAGATVGKYEMDRMGSVPAGAGLFRAA